MRFVDTEELAAIQQRAIVARDLLWGTARDFSGAPVTFGFSSFVRNLEIPVRDGRTGAVVNRTFIGLGGALKIGAIPLSADIMVRTVEIELPAIDAVVEQLVRGHDIRSAPVQIYRAYLDPDTRNQLAPAKPRFVGYIDGAPIETPPAGGTGRVRITCASTTRELTRASTDVRSHESQLARTGGADDFYIVTAVVAEWELHWGQARGGGGMPPGSGFGGQSGFAR